MDDLPDGMVRLPGRTPKTDDIDTPSAEQIARLVVRTLELEHHQYSLMALVEAAKRYCDFFVVAPPADAPDLSLERHRVSEVQLEAIAGFVNFLANHKGLTEVVSADDLKGATDGKS